MEQAEHLDTQKHHFKSDVTRVLDIVINSLYSHKEIFLRELISNASDACEKLRYEAVNNEALYEGDPALKIKLSFDKEKRTLTISDNGIGMSFDEVQNNLGTIARSGTQEFFKSLTGDASKDSSLIGQFGVGFYSAFIVADKVEVMTRRAGMAASDGVYWSSTGKGDYEIAKSAIEHRGTTLVLHLKAEEDEFLNGYRLRHVIRTYSDNITFPVVMQKESLEENAPASSEPEEEFVNQATALWTRPKSDITDEQYEEFYKHMAHDFSAPLAWSHNRVEGKLDYTSLIYIPSRVGYDLYQPGRPHGLKLFVRRVFIMDDAEQLLPNYLRFVRGIVDSNDLPLNISREILQSHKIIDTIKTAVTKRTLGLLQDLADNHSEKYQQFWTTFGQVLKEGPAEDFANKEAIAKLLRFATTHEDSSAQTQSLDNYISRMKEGQSKIYYLAADSYMAAKNSPHLELFRKKGIEVLLLSDRIDEWLMSHLSEYLGKSFDSIARGELNNLEFAKEPSEDEAFSMKKEDYQSVLERMKSVLSDKVQEVRLTQRLTDSPACIVADEHGMTTQMERLLRSAGQQVHNLPILELNPDNRLIQKIKSEKDEAKFSEWTRLLLDQAILSEGGQLEDPGSFVKRFNELLLNVMKD